MRQDQRINCTINPADKETSHTGQPLEVAAAGGKLLQPCNVGLHHLLVDGWSQGQLPGALQQ